MTCKELGEQYATVFNEYKEGKQEPGKENPFKSNDNKITEILERGLYYCNNDTVLTDNILVLCGINPSGDGKNKGNIIDSYCPFKYAKDQGRSDYWEKKHNQFGGKDSDLVQNHIAYFDLLPLINSEQGDVESSLKKYNDFRFDLIKITAKAIEDLKPKLIIHANKASLYYWGLHPSKYCKDTKKPWLNYSFKDITLDCPVLITYKERLNKYKGINKEQSFTKEFVHLFEISGNGIFPKTYFLSYIMERFSFTPWQKEQLLTDNEMLALWQWCCIH